MQDGSVQGTYATEGVGGGWGRGRYTRRISMGELACVAKNQHEKCDCNGAVGGGGGGA